MSRRSEIMQRAQHELQAAIDRFTVLREEILTQQRDVLTTNIPALKTALDVFEKALADAFAVHQQGVGAADAAVADAEVEASAARFAAEQDADANWRDANDKASLKRQLALQRAEDDFNEAFDDAQKVTGAGRERAVKSARAKRDAVVAGAERTCALETDAAWQTLQEDQAGAREKEIATFEKARAVQADAADKAADTHDAARAKAGKALEKVIAADPVAASIREAFRLRLEEAEAATEREKQDVIDRMKADLERAAP